MTVTLTLEQSRQLSEAANPLTYAVDPASRRRYVVLGSDVFAHAWASSGDDQDY